MTRKPRRFWRLAAKVTFMLLSSMPSVQVLEYMEATGRSPFAAWFDDLNAEAAAKVSSALYQLSAGNFSNLKGVGGGVLERRIDFGPGYRIYLGKDGETILILLGGSSKQRQREAIETAKVRWREYKKRKSAT